MGIHSTEILFIFIFSAILLILRRGRKLNDWWPNREVDLFMNCSLNRADVSWAPLLNHVGQLNFILRVLCFARQKYMVPQIEERTERAIVSLIWNFEVEGAPEDNGILKLFLFSAHLVQFLVLAGVSLCDTGNGNGLINGGTT